MLYQTTTNNEKEFKAELKKVVETHPRPVDCLSGIGYNRHRAAVNTHNTIPAEAVAEELIRHEEEFMSADKIWKGDLWYYV